MGTLQRRSRPNGHSHEVVQTPSGLQCPTCSAPISAEQFAQIQGTLRAHDAEIERTVEARFARQITETERKKKSEIARAVQLAVKVSETKLKALRKGQAGVIAAALEAERERSRTALSEAVGATKLEHAAEKLKLEQQLGDLQRKLAAKPAHAIGLPAEIDLHQQISAMLAATAPEDRATRVPPGVPGVDVIIEVVHRAEVCGTILVESKAHKTWKSSFTTRLRENQIREGTAFAILASPIFWSGAAPHIALRDGVICAKPECVPMLVALLREIVLGNHIKALGMQARDAKGERALQFLASSMCDDLFERLLRFTRDLTALDQREQSVHATTWTRRAEIVHGLIAVREQFVRTVGDIVTGVEPLALDGAAA